LPGQVGGPPEGGGAGPPPPPPPGHPPPPAPNPGGMALGRFRGPHYKGGLEGGGGGRQTGGPSLPELRRKRAVLFGDWGGGTRGGDLPPKGGGGESGGGGGQRGSPWEGNAVVEKPPPGRDSFFVLGRGGLQGGGGGQRGGAPNGFGPVAAPPSGPRPPLGRGPRGAGPQKGHPGGLGKKKKKKTPRRSEGGVDGLRGKGFPAFPATPGPMGGVPKSRPTHRGPRLRTPGGFFAPPVPGAEFLLDESHGIAQCPGPAHPDGGAKGHRPRRPLHTRGGGPVPQPGGGRTLGRMGATDPGKTRSPIGPLSQFRGPWAGKGGCLGIFWRLHSGLGRAHPPPFVFIQARSPRDRVGLRDFCFLFGPPHFRPHVGEGGGGPKGGPFAWGPRSTVFLWKSFPSGAAGGGGPRSRARGENNGHRRWAR